MARNDRVEWLSPVLRVSVAPHSAVIAYKQEDCRKLWIRWDQLEGILVLFSYTLCVYWLQLKFSSQCNWYPAEVRPWYSTSMLTFSGKPWLRLWTSEFTVWICTVYYENSFSGYFLLGLYPSSGVLESVKLIKPLPVAARSRRGSAAARLLGLWVRIPPLAWMSISTACLLSGIGLCDELIPRPEVSYRLLCVCVW